MRAKWPLALVFWLGLGAIVWAQVTVGGTSFPLFAPDGLIGAPVFAFASSPTTGFWNTGGNMAYSHAGAIVAAGNSTTGMRLTSSYFLGWTPAAANGTSADLNFGRNGAPGSLRVLSGTTPTQSAATCGGAGFTITGDNSNGSVILGAAPTLPCAIVFNGTQTSAPHCYLTPEILTTGTTTVRPTSITTTGFVITSTAALVATDKVTWFCVGE